MVPAAKSPRPSTPSLPCCRGISVAVSARTFSRKSWRRMGKRLSPHCGDHWAGLLQVSASHRQFIAARILCGNVPHRGMEAFIPELGVGFAFLERQKRITVYGGDYYLDLLFNHGRLRRLAGNRTQARRFQAGCEGADGAVSAMAGQLRTARGRRFAHLAHFVCWQVCPRY
jgi:hypothetical protein